MRGPYPVSADQKFKAIMRVVRMKPMDEVYDGRTGAFLRREAGPDAPIPAPSPETPPSAAAGPAVAILAPKKEPPRKVGRLEAAGQGELF